MNFTPEEQEAMKDDARKMQAELLLKFQQERDNPDNVPDHAMTAQEYAGEIGATVTVAKSLLEDAVNAGVMMSGQKRVKRGHLVWHWWANDE